MSSGDLERIRELAESGRLHTWDIRRASDGHMSAVEADVSPDVLALLAEVARLEQERDEARHGRELARLDTENERRLLAVAREREQRAVNARRKAHRLLGEAYEALRDNPPEKNCRPDTARKLIARARAALVDEPAAETDGAIRLLVRAADRLADAVAHRIKVGHLDARSEAGDALLDYVSLTDHRAALGIAPREPAAATSTAWNAGSDFAHSAAATLAEPGGIGGSGATGATTAAGRRVATPGLKTDASSPGSASAAADEPGETP